MKYPVWTPVCQSIFGFIDLYGAVVLDKSGWNGYIIHYMVIDNDHVFMNG